jgi:hypothetical protein
MFYPFLLGDQCHPGADHLLRSAYTLFIVVFLVVLKVEAVCSSEMLVHTVDNPEDHD